MTEREVAEQMYMADRKVAIETATDKRFAKLYWGRDLDDASYDRQQEYLRWARKALAILKPQ